MEFFKRRPKPEMRAQLTEDSFSALLLGERVTAEQAMEIPAFSGCVDFIAKIVAMLPIKLYQEKDGETEEVSQDIRIKLLNDETGDTLDSYQMKYAVVEDYLVHGNGYIYTHWRGNQVESLHYVAAKSVSVTGNCEPVFKRNQFSVNGMLYPEYRFIKLLRRTKDGGTGQGILEENQQVLEVARNSLKFENNTVRNGGNKKGFLKSEKPLSEQAFTQLKNAWKRLHTNEGDSVMVLNSGVDFKESSNTSVEMQLNENKQTNAREICSLFGLSPEIIAGKADDEQYISAFKTAVIPVITALETALNRELLLETEKGSFYFAFDTSELLKGDIEKRFKAYEIALRANFMQLDEVRYKEDLKPLGFNFIRLGLQDVLLNPITNEVYTPNTNATANMNSLQGGEQLVGSKD